jgi:hypothetical protein
MTVVAALSPHDRDLPGPEGQSPGPQIRTVLALLAQSLQSGAQEVRAMALLSIPDPALRTAMLLNPRLTGRINTRMFGEDCWVFPEDLDDFPQAGPLIALLQAGPAAVFDDIGLAWHGNQVARALISGTKEAAHLSVDRAALRIVLGLRTLAAPETENGWPDAAAIRQDGALCIWCWMAALPSRISAIALAVLLKDCCAYQDYNALAPAARASRAALADAWLHTALVCAPGTLSAAVSPATSQRLVQP